MEKSETKKVALIAPITPFRSGVAKHSTQVALELNKRVDISSSTYSFKRLYPKILFPGDNDKEEGTIAPQSLNAHFELDAVNPITWYKLVNKLVSENTEVVVIPCWTFFVAPCLGWIARQCKKKGIKVISIVHNAFDHEAGGIKNALMRYQLKSDSHFLCHNNALAKQVRTELPEATIAINPHPLFDQYPSANGTLKKRASIELLFFGLIRDYKGLDILLDAKLKDEDIYLTIAGECWGDINTYITQAEQLKLSSKVEFIARYVSDEEAAELFDRCDAVILPYRSMTGSGVIPLAFHYGKPVITSDLPGFKEIVSDVNGVIAKGVQSQDIAQAIVDFKDLRSTKLNAESVKKSAEMFSWENFCKALI
jgi:D-inositol-3-phosphate glycosyltransferase